MSYIDGFVIPISVGSREVTKRVVPVFNGYGALRIVECWADDLPDGKITDFKGAVKAEAGETVVFSLNLRPSKAVRDGANKRIITDSRLTGDMLFDGKHPTCDGFQILLDTEE